MASAPLASLYSCGESRTLRARRSSLRFLHGAQMRAPLSASASLTLPLRDSPRLNAPCSPERSLYNLAAANVFENMVSHVALLSHRLVVWRAAHADAGAAQHELHPEQRGHSAGFGTAAGGSYVVKQALFRSAELSRARVRALVWLAISAVPISVVLTILGARVDVVKFRFEGLAGALLGDEQRTRSMSLITIGRVLSNATYVQGASAPEELYGSQFIMTLYWLFHLAMPLALGPLLLALWLLPMTIGAQHSLFAVASMVHAWAALDVFVIAVIAAVTEIEPFTRFILKDRCDSIDAFIEEYLFELVDGDARCFGVTATLGAGCWLCFVAVAFSLLSSGLVLARASGALDRRQQLFDNSSKHLPAAAAAAKAADGVRALTAAAHSPGALKAADPNADSTSGPQSTSAGRKWVPC
jgi:hypothetical protein